MKDHRTFIRRAATAVAALTLSLQPPLQLVSAAMGQSQTPKPPATTTTTTTTGTTKTTATATASATKATPTPPPNDGGWPRTYQLSRGGTILVYQPQIASWDSQKRMVAWSAVSYRSYVEQKPLFGTVKIESDTNVSTTERLVRFDKMRLT